jgi:ABC-type ATPase involved in cell division
VVEDAYILHVNSQSSLYLNVVDVDFAYRPGRWLFRGLTMSLKRGEGIVAFAKRGTGKSTLIRLLVGLVLPSAGDIKLHERSIHDMSLGERTHMLSKWGLILDNPVILPDRSLLANLKIVARLSSRRDQSVNAAAKSCLSEFGLSHRMTQKPARFTEDEVHIIQLAVALAKTPDMVFWDDPDAFLGTDQLETAIEVVRRANLAGAGVILTTSNPALFDQLHWRVIDLERYQT